MPIVPLSHKYDYRRDLPHLQKRGCTLYVTFCKLQRWQPFPQGARDLILTHCLHDHGIRYDLLAAVVMPEHVHLLLTPLVDKQGWPHSLAVILQRLKGVSAHSVNRLMGIAGPVWQEESFDHVLRNDESLAKK